MSRAASEPIHATSLVARALEAVGVAYAIGGSLASSVHGEPRSTNDGDLLAALGLRHVEALVAALGADFFADAPMMRDAIGAGEPFNVIHLPTMFKIDIFVAGSDELAREELTRRQRVEIEGELLYVASPEDTVVQKLAWYRKGNEISDRQWGDVRGVLRVQLGRLDLDYMHKWARHAGVEDLLDRALAEVASEPRV